MCVSVGRLSMKAPGMQQHPIPGYILQRLIDVNARFQRFHASLIKAWRYWTEILSY